MTIQDITEAGSAARRGAVELLQWSITYRADEAAVDLAGELDLSNVAALGDVLTQLLKEKPSRLTLDLKSLRFCDSSGIHCLIRAAEHAEAVGCVLTARHPSAAVLRVLEICGVDEILLDGGSEGPAETRR